MQAIYFQNTESKLTSKSTWTTQSIALLMFPFSQNTKVDLFAVKIIIFKKLKKKNHWNKKALKTASEGKPGPLVAAGVSFAKGTVDGARLCDSSLPAPQWSNCFPVSAQQFLLPSLCAFLVACSIYFNVYLCAKPVSEWLDTPLICGLQGGGRSAAYSHDIRGLCRAKKTFSGTPNPWAPSKYHNLSAQLTWATWDTWGL